MRPTAKRAESDALAADVAAFLARGNSIEVVPTGVSGIRSKGGVLRASYAAENDRKRRRGRSRKGR